MPHNTPVGKNVIWSTLFINRPNSTAPDSGSDYVIREILVGKDFSHNVILNCTPWATHFLLSVRGNKFVQSFSTIRDPLLRFSLGVCVPLLLHIHGSVSWPWVLKPNNCLWSFLCWWTCLRCLCTWWSGEILYNRPWAYLGFILVLGGRKLEGAASGHWVLMMQCFFLVDGSPIFILQIWLPACLLSAWQSFNRSRLGARYRRRVKGGN